MQDKYKIIGHVYGFLSKIYSGKPIQRCREAMIEHMKPGDKVVFAGVGYGEDAIKAAEKGADVTIVELSETMLSKFRQTLAASGAKVSIRQIHADILAFSEFEKFDYVVSNFFLNIFDRAMMQKVLQHLAKLGKPGANIVIGDFIYPSGNVLSKAFQVSYWYLANALFWILASNPLHNIYDYPSLMSNIGLKVQEKRIYKLLFINCFWSVRAIKVT